jgi:hypothetical protein
MRIPEHHNKDTDHALEQSTRLQLGNPVELSLQKFESTWCGTIFHTPLEGSQQQGTKLPEGIR